MASIALCQLGVSALDKAVFPGCTVIGYENSGRTLQIRIDPGIDDGTDSGCLAAARIIENICRQGYRVRYWGRVIDHAETMWLVKLGGGPVTEDYAEHLMNEAHYEYVVSDRDE